jgi:hypothetical protein
MKIREITAVATTEVDAGFDKLRVVSSQVLPVLPASSFSNVQVGKPLNCWWAWVELNYRPHPYQGCALAT